MKIEVRNDDTVELRTIPMGECFTYGKDFYMRVTEGAFLCGGESVTAINLGTGSLCAFTLLCRVFRVKLKIVNDI